MIIERTSEGILIKTTVPTDTRSAQRVIEYFNLLEIASHKQGTEKEAALLADEVDRKYWEANKHRFLK